MPAERQSGAGDERESEDGQQADDLHPACHHGHKLGIDDDDRRVQVVLTHLNQA
ncbi:hypothetical protein [Micromonospora musae]|uniref:hypothetical protein n=1 Tax=Micromonospora musae TaxID=1894970 RepID=UPI003448753A